MDRDLAFQTNLSNFGYQAGDTAQLVQGVPNTVLCEPDVVHMPVILAPGTWRQEDQQFKIIYYLQEALSQTKQNTQSLCARPLVLSFLQVDVLPLWPLPIVPTSGYLEFPG